MSKVEPRIKKVEPSSGIIGGEVRIICEGFSPSLKGESQILFGGVAGRMISASPSHIVAVVPEGVPSVESNSGVRLLVDERLSEPAPFKVGEKVAGELHPVANPVIDPDNGSIYVTLSGTRGQKSSHLDLQNFSRW